MAGIPAGSVVYVIGNARDAAQLRTVLAHTRDIAAVGPPQVKDGLVLLQGTLAVPPDSQAAYTVVSRVRAALAPRRVVRPTKRRGLRGRVRKPNTRSVSSSGTTRLYDQVGRTGRPGGSGRTALRGRVG